MLTLTATAMLYRPGQGTMAVTLHAGWQAKWQEQQEGRLQVGRHSGAQPQRAPLMHGAQAAERTAHMERAAQRAAAVCPGLWPLDF